MGEKVIAIFDAGRTNKKLFLFNRDYKIVFEKSVRLTEIEDEDGFICESIVGLQSSVSESLLEIGKMKEFEVTAVNFSSYGASFVYLDKNSKPLTPVYSYLKPYPENLTRQFFSKYGDPEQFCRETASPLLGSLNSGMQLYRIKNERPKLFADIYTALHLPQYLSFLVTGKCFSDLTSIGCHTGLWDFEKNDYHSWVYEEKIDAKFATVLPANAVIPCVYRGQTFVSGGGLHDSSAAIMPYLFSFSEPFVLISTGTWAISMNPFDNTPLTPDDLRNDCLKYLRSDGKSVKAARLFSGHEYEQQLKRIAAHFHSDTFWFKSLKFDADMLVDLNEMRLAEGLSFEDRDLSVFVNDKQAFYQLILDLVGKQKISTGYVMKNSGIKRVFVDGGFSKNVVYMNLLAAAFPETEVFAASMAQATAVGTALAIHSSWNPQAVPNDLIELKYYANNHFHML